MLVRKLLDTVRLTLQETTTDGVRWTLDELIQYLNDAYRFLMQSEHEAFCDNSEFECVQGTRQELPAGATRLISVVRNIDGSKMPVQASKAGVLDRIVPGWHGETATSSQELFVYDDRDPLVFYVYPPAVAGSLLEIKAAMSPDDHLKRDYEAGTEHIRVSDRYVVALTSYILHRCFDKDADDGGNYARSQSYLQAAYNALNVKMQNTARTSPNNPVNKQ